VLFSLDIKMHHRDDPLMHGRYSQGLALDRQCTKGSPRSRREMGRECTGSGYLLIEWAKGIWGM